MTEGPWADLPVDVNQIKHELKIRREAIQSMMGDITLLSKLLEDKVGKIAYLKYMQEVGLSAQADIFGRKPNVE